MSSTKRLDFFNKLVLKLLKPPRDNPPLPSLLSLCNQFRMLVSAVEHVMRLLQRLLMWMPRLLLRQPMPRLWLEQWQMCIGFTIALMPAAGFKLSGPTPVDSVRMNWKASYGSVTCAKLLRAIVARETDFEWSGTGFD